MCFYTVPPFVFEKATSVSITSSLNDVLNSTFLDSEAGRVGIFIRYKICFEKFMQWLVVVKYGQLKFQV